MFATIHIGDKDVGMLANAASPYIYKQVFHEDLLLKFTHMKEDPDNSLGEKLGFIFAKQAEISDISELMKLDMNAFLEWLTDFDPLDIIMVSEEIADLYQQQRAVSSVPKGKGE